MSVSSRQTTVLLRADDLQRHALNDSDADGSCDSVDLCLGDDTAGDADSDGLCEDGNDLCLAGSDALDFDADGIADACDICPNDPGGDATCDNVAVLSRADLSGVTWLTASRTLSRSALDILIAGEVGTGYLSIESLGLDS